MASKFLIEIKYEHKSKQGSFVCMIDDTLDETTGWIKVDQGLDGQSDEVLFAGALLKSSKMRDMVKVAQEVAYAVWLREEYFDIHQVDEQWAKAKVESTKMDTEGLSANPLDNSQVKSVLPKIKK